MSEVHSNRSSLLHITAEGSANFKMFTLGTWVMSSISPRER